MILRQNIKMPMPRWTGSTLQRHHHQVCEKKRFVYSRLNDESATVSSFAVPRGVISFQGKLKETIYAVLLAGI